MDLAKVAKTNPFSGEDHEDYHDWSFNMKCVFDTHGYGFVIAEVMGEEDDVPENAAELDGKVFACLALACKAEAKRIVRQADREYAVGHRGRAAWVALKQQYAGRGAENVNKLNMDVIGRNWKDNDTLRTFVNDIDERYERARACGGAGVIPGRLVRSHVLTQLPDEMFQGIKVRSIANEEQTFEELVADLRLYDRSMSISKKMAAAKQPAVDDAAPGGSGKERCDFCGSQAHAVKDCKKYAKYKLIAQQEGDDDGSDDKETPLQTAAIAKEQPQHRHAAFVVVDKGHVSDTTVVLDSGAVQHVFCNKNMFSSLNPVAEEDMIITANGKTAVSGKGAVHLDLELTSGGCSTITLTDVLWVPSAPVNLISASRLIQEQQKNAEGVTIVHSGQQSRIEITKDVVIKLCEENGLFVVKPCRIGSPTSTVAGGAVRVGDRRGWPGRGQGAGGQDAEGGRR